MQNPFNWYLNGLTGEGTNSTDAIKANIFYAVLANKPENLNYIVNEFKGTVETVEYPNAGVYEDSANIMHDMLDFYGYYSTFILDSMRIFGYFDGTSFMPSTTELDGFSSSLVNGAAWTMYDGYRELGASGRTMKGPFTQADTQVVKQGLEFVASHEGRWKEEAQKILDRYNSGHETVTGHKHFYSGDFTFHKTDNSYVSVRMSSPRMTAAEAWGGYGQTNIFMGDGCMWIMNDAKKIYDTNMLPCLDWNRLAGTTVVKDLLPYKFYSYYQAGEPFVGGVSDGDYGVTAQNLSHTSIPLTAQKGWFFFDDEVVCLGSGITSSSQNETHTIVDQKIKTGAKTVVDGVELSDSKCANNVLKNVSWIADEGAGYYFPTKTDVNINRATRAGSWSLLNTAQSATKLYANITSMYINHGSKANDSTYEYVVLPNATASEVRNYAESDNVEILENSDRIQAVHDVSTDTTGIIFRPNNREFCENKYIGDYHYTDGILRRSLLSNDEVKVTEIIVDGKKGSANYISTNSYQGYTVADERIKGKVKLSIEWFDDKDAVNGSNWYVSYTTKNGVKNTSIVPYRYTDTWKTTEFILDDVDFTDATLMPNDAEIQIIHNNSKINLNNSKYEVDSRQGASIYSTTADAYAYGPIISCVKLEPYGKEKEIYNEKLGDVEVDTPMIVMERRIDDETMELSFCEPTQVKRNVKLTLDGVYSIESPVEDVSVAISTGKTVINAQTQKGRSYVLKLKKK